ncbi:hypothetical protein KB206_10850 [Microvirga sp. STS02]|uniref:hypothetical protein n=1 Tax=Hymenobacter negativus TaxID=2795026 RepID=UPI0018DC8406|nr:MULTISPECIES: hypothetical protein [Bacteria]MBH8569384.1 hypothetical protein [Hymenobacter negativus]MBR7209119.1 hypothetical protein [Microvirga sp. STS02]
MLSAEISAPAATAHRIPLVGRLTPEQVAQHNAFIDEMREPAIAPAWTEQPSCFVGCKSGLPDYTTA